MHFGKSIAVLTREIRAVQPELKCVNYDVKTAVITLSCASGQKLLFQATKRNGHNMLCVVMMPCSKFQGTKDIGICLSGSLKMLASYCD